ncbi:hypothetical protein NDU88_002374 [Pleurodeles waltl]|uniref:Uncharacterized protein n=1 Tax=Pleurodeles waltl TaxID=8319 RepID=A0AAV7MNK6_PLEWA|nr:hypothetical protein NDU88_002374 [Pleurodeles waltl]
MSTEALSWYTVVAKDSPTHRALPTGSLNPLRGAPGPGDAHGAAGLGGPAREREERGEPGRVRSHESAEWRRPGDSHQQREKCGDPQSSRGEGKEPGVLGEGEAPEREDRALERLLSSSLRSPSPPLPPSS